MYEKIKIVAAPPGQAPEWVREAWIGIELPLAQPISGGVQVGIMLGKPENIGGYTVNSAQAFQLLQKHNIEAWNWWNENAPYAMRCGQLVFKKQACELIEN